MNELLATPENIQLDADGRIANDVACLACGYNLRGLLPDGRCPECGIAVGRSTQGDLLRFCDPRWVGQLASGMDWIVAGIVVMIVVSILFSTRDAVISKQSDCQPAGLLAWMATCLVGLIGYWKVTTPDPGRLDPEPRINARKLVRVLQVVTFVCIPISASVGPLIAGHVVLVSAVLGIVGMFATFIYAKHLALRIPDPKLARRTMFVMWGLVLTFGITLAVVLIAIAANTQGPRGFGVGILNMIGGGCAMVLGILIFGIWSIVLLVKYRKALKQAAEMARATWASDQ